MRLIFCSIAVQSALCFQAKAGFKGHQIFSQRALPAATLMSGELHVIRHYFPCGGGVALLQRR